MMMTRVRRSVAAGGHVRCLAGRQALLSDHGSARKREAEQHSDRGAPDPVHIESIFLQVIHVEFVTSGVARLAPFFSRVEATAIATTIAQSLMLTAGLSAVHLIGFTLLMGSAVVSNLRLIGVLFPRRPVLEVTGPAGRGLALGFGISVTTGLLLFTGRASAASENGIFQLKMLLLVTAAVFHFGLQRKIIRRASVTPRLLRVTGALGLTLWFSVALTACAFILLE